MNHCKMALSVLANIVLAFEASLVVYLLVSLQPVHCVNSLLVR